MNQKSSGFAVEQQAKRDVPRLLADWVGKPAQLVRAGVGAASKDPNRADFAVQVGDLVFVVEVKSRSLASSLAQALEQARASAKAISDREQEKRVLPLVVVPYMTKWGKERLEKEDISWLDLSGNARIRINAPFRVNVHVEGKPNLFRDRGRPKNLFAPKAARLARHLLLRPGGAFTQRELAESVDLDEGYVSKLIRRMEIEDLLIRDNEGRVQPRSYELLLDAWAEGNAYRHEPLSGHVPGRSGEDVVRRVAKVLEAEEFEYAATGLSAAWAYTRAAGFRTASVYIREPPPNAVLDALGFREDTRAPNLTLLLPDDEGVFVGARPVEGFNCVAPVQAFVDLQRESERAEEFGQALRAKILTSAKTGSDA